MERPILTSNYNSYDLQDGDKERSPLSYTIEEAIENIGIGLFQIRLAIIMGCFIMADACEMMLLSVLSQPLRCEWNLENWQIASLTMAVFFGMLIFSSVWGRIGDVFGRWPMLLTISAWTCYFGFLSTFSPTFGWLVLLRSLVGIGIAGFPQAITLQAEFYSSKYRSKFINLSQLFWSFGSIFEVVLAFSVIPRLGWRWQIALSSLPLAVMLIFFTYIPESPRFYLAQNNVQGAEKILHEVFKTNKKPIPTGDLVPSKGVSFMPFSTPFNYIFNAEYFTTTIVLWLLWFAHAFSYYGVILISSDIYERSSSCFQKVKEIPVSCNCNVLNVNDYFSLLISTCGELFALPINLVLLEKIGRTRSLAVLMFGASVSYMLLLICAHRSLITFILFLVRTLVSASYNALYIYTVEVYPTIVRALAMGLSSGSARIGAMLTPIVAQVFMGYSPAASMGIYSGLCLIASVCSLLLPIETKNKDLKDQ